MRTLIWLCVVGLAGCGDVNPAAQVAPAASSSPAEAAPPRPAQVNVALQSRATVVLRVERVAAEGGSKYHWDEVRPLEVIKNDSTQTFDAPLRVAHYGWHAGVPEGVSTIYLEPYGATELWRLLDGDGAVGVSHAGAR